MTTTSSTAALALSAASFLLVSAWATHWNRYKATKKKKKKKKEETRSDDGNDNGDDDFAPQRTMGALYSKAFLDAIAPLYDAHMGCENMGPMLYALVRFVKSARVLEVGAGYTSIFLLQALHDNQQELLMNNHNGGSGSEHPHQPCLHIMDNMEHEDTTAHLVQTVARQLGIDEHLQVIVADCYAHSFDSDDDEESLLFDFVWLDGITTDERFPKLFDTYWQRHLRVGGYVALHSTLTNAVTRQWMAAFLRDMALRAQKQAVRLEIVPHHNSAANTNLEKLVPQLQQQICVSGLEWQENGHAVVDIGFGIQKLMLRAWVDAPDQAEAAAEAIAEWDGIARAEVLANDSDDDDDNASSSPAYLQHLHFWEPHKKFQNSFTLFQKRTAAYQEPLYSWSP